MKSISRLKRAAAILGVGAIVVGGAVLGAGSAHAAGRVGTDPTIGDISLTVGGVTPNNASTSAAINYSSTACPTGATSSASVRIIDPVTGTSAGSLAPNNNGAGAAFTGTIAAGSLATIISIDPALAGATDEIVVLCNNAPSLTGTTNVFFQDTYVTINAAGTTFTETNTPPAGPVTPSFNISASSPAYAGQNITLTASLTASANGTPAGTIDFQLQGTGTDITGGQAPNAANPATLSGGTANFTTNSFVAAQTYQVVAVFTTADATKWTTTTSAPFALVVTTAPQFGGQLHLATTVPASGAFSITVDTTDIFNLTVSGSTATDGPGGTSPNAVVVVDQRNNYPGWSVSGQAGPWTGTAGSSAAGGTIPADNLGFAPTVTGGSGGDHAGPAVTAGTSPNGLGDGANVWAFAHAGLQGGVNGFGTSNLNAVFTLNIPASAPAGPYTSSFSVTGVNTNP
jgi:hypothetical protein